MKFAKLTRGVANWEIESTTIEHSRKEHQRKVTIEHDVKPNERASKSKCCCRGEQ